jgi:RNA polymerase sigma-70 factor (ECF subfamily)
VDLEAVAKEVFTRLQRCSDELIVANPQAYLFRIAAQVAGESPGHEHTQIDGSGELDGAAEEPRANQQIRAALDKLPPRQRELLMLHVNEGLTYQQIADRVGLSNRVVLRDLVHAYSRLRMELPSIR